MNPQTLVARAAALFLLAMGLGAFPGAALAECPVQEEAGSWVNEWSQANSVARVELGFKCQDQIKGGRPYPPGPEWIIQVYGRCEPYDCDWKKTAARRLATGHIYAIYDQGFAFRYVYAKTSRYRKGMLWVYTWTDFKDPDRQDYGVHDWFVRRR